MTKEEKAFFKAHRKDDVNDLLLHAARYPDMDMKSMAVQIRGWQLAEKKLPLWADTDGILFPEHLPMEQCSSQSAAQYKSQIVCELFDEICEKRQIDNSSEQNVGIADLTGGFGVDAAMLAKAFHSSVLTFVEKNQTLCDLANNNFPLLGLNNYNIICGSCEDVLPSLPHQSFIFIDPARRDAHGRKTVAIADCVPDITLLNDLLLEKSDFVMVKLSPMIDISSALNEVRGVVAVHVVSVDGECKEVLLVLDGKAEDKVPIRHYCVNILKGRQVVMEYDSVEAKTVKVGYAEQTMRYVYEPNASVMKAGAVNIAAEQFGLLKLHPNSQLLTSDAIIHDFPGRTFEVVESFSFAKSDIQRLRSIIKKANVAVRNFHLSVAELRKRLKINEGGNDYLFATTLYDNSHVIVLCRKTF